MKIFKLFIAVLSISFFFSQSSFSQSFIVKNSESVEIKNFARWAATPSVKVIHGDFNGDGKEDIALVRQTNGWNTIPIAFSNGNGTYTVKNSESSQIKEFAHWAATPDVRIIQGDFNGDRKEDIALVRQKGGWETIPIAFSNGNGTYKVTNSESSEIKNFAHWAATSGVKVIQGDFNGDGKEDIALVRQTSGWSTMPIAFSNGNGTYKVTNSKSFEINDFAYWAATSGVKVIHGDFNGDDKEDIALVRQTSGWNTMPIAFSNGDGTYSVRNSESSEIKNFARWAATPGVEVIHGDFNGDSKEDIALVRKTSGWNTMPIAFSNGNGTYKITNSENSQIKKFAHWAATSGVKVIHGDFNGDSKEDIALVRQTGGWTTIPVAFSNGNGTYNVTNSESRGIKYFTRWAATSGVKVIHGDFNGNSKEDIALVRQTGGWSTMPIAYATTSHYPPLIIPEYTALSNKDNIRGWDFEGYPTYKASYLGVENGQPYVYIGTYKDNKFTEINKVKLGKRDNLRSWNWDGETASYHVVQNDGTVTLSIRSFDGQTFGPHKSVPFTTKDIVKGWHWDGNTGYYVVRRGNGKYSAFRRSFDGETFGKRELMSDVIFGDDWVRGFSYGGYQTYSYPCFYETTKETPLVFKYAIN